MHRSVKIISAATALWLAATFAQASAPAKTPEELMKNLISSAQQGNTETFLASLTTSSRKAVSDSFARQASVQTAQQAFQQALDEKFGKGGEVLSAPADDLKSAISRLTSAELLETKPGSGGTAHLRVKTTVKTANGKTLTKDETLLVKQEGGGWKLVLGFPQRQRPDSRSVLEKLTKEVKDGQLQDRTEAMIALSNALGSGSAKGGTAK
jgi:hypothetical protein